MENPRTVAKLLRMVIGSIAVGAIAAIIVNLISN